VIGNLRWELPTFGPWGVALAARHVDRAHLANDGNAALVTPAHSTLNVALRWARDGREVRAELNNALDADAYAGGYTDGSTRYLYPIASRNVLVTVRLPIGR